MTHLLDEHAGDRGALSIPLIAKRAGVTPSTIYRRWGDLQQLLAAVATDQALGEPVPDTGSFAGDLADWLDLYLDEFASPLGRQILRDIAADRSSTGRYYDILREQLETMRAAAVARGEDPPDVDRIVDTVVAPITYRTLFTDATSESLHARARDYRRILDAPR